MWKCTYIETSAKTNYNIEAIFEEILELEQQRALYLQSEEDKVNVNCNPSDYFYLKYQVEVLWVFLLMDLLCTFGIFYYSEF